MKFKQIFLIIALPLAVSAAAVPYAPSVVTLGETEYEVERLIDRQVGPGVQYVRYRVPAYPLNINVLTVDLTNPYNRVENTTANDRSAGTELLVAAAARQSHDGHHAVAGANANFWVVSGGADYPAYSGTTRNGSLHNGQIVIESNQFADQFDWGTMSTGVIGISDDKQVYIDRCLSEIVVAAESFGVLNVHECNKGVKPGEIGMYNDLYGADTEFKPVSGDWKLQTGTGATEIILDLADGEQWRTAEPIRFVVKEVRRDAGNGTLGSHDLALVGRDGSADALALLNVGDEVALRYQWTFRPDVEDQAVTPVLENLVGGNGMVLIDGEKTANNDFQEYNSMIYSRCCYGRSADRKMLYIVVVDKATDAFYGQSVGCTTAIVCDFMKTLGCTDMSNCDAGGSAQMFVRDRIVNKTTESTPRAVANGMLVYSVAPEDNEVASLAFDEISLRAPVYGQFSPKVIAYNKYGYPIDYEFADFTLSCDASLGSCDGSMFTAAGIPGSGTLTASYGEASVSAPLEVIEAAIGIRVKEIVLDAEREYPVEVVAELAGQSYTYDASSFAWTLDREGVASISPEGVLRGEANGTATLKAAIGDYSDEATVSVEIPDAPALAVGSWDEWTAKGTSGITNVTLAADGLVSYTYGSPRDAYVQLQRTSRLYSLPDRLRIVFRSSLPVVSMSIDLRAAFDTRANTLVLEAPDGQPFAPGADSEMVVNIADYFDTTDMAIYPLTLSSVRFTFDRDSSYKGEQTVALDGIRTEYDHYVAGVDCVKVADGSPIVVVPATPAAGTPFTIKAEGAATAALYTPSGRLAARTNLTAGTGTLTATTPGIYILTTPTAAIRIAIR